MQRYVCSTVHRGLSMTKIKVLDAEVIKRIAAGETLQRPVNAVKELIENSLDAGADRISIFVQVPNNSSNTETSAGLFSIQVTDNGSGIDKEDFELLCERHATSKLRQVSDLGSVETFGFRGEALASCAQVARVEVITKSRESEDEVAWRVNYVSGRLVDGPEPLAGNFGTIISVKDLFYGNRVRREALQTSTEEYQKIVQTVQAYALNQAGRCAFSLSRKRDRIELQTTLSEGPVAVVKGLWNGDLGSSLLPFEIAKDSSLGIEPGSCGWASRTTFHKLKSATVILFLNDRLIEHAVLRRALLQAFSAHLPTSPPAYPFIFVRLFIKGNRVDVNVHPSKRQIFFLDEADIVGRVVEAVEGGILRRQYETQTLQPIVIDRPVKRAKDEQSSRNTNVDSATTSISKISTLYPSQRVLTDHRNHRIDTFLFHSSQSSSLMTSSSPTTSWTPLEKRNNSINNNKPKSATMLPLQEEKENIAQFKGKTQIESFEGGQGCDSPNNSLHGHTHDESIALSDNSMSISQEHPVKSVEAVKCAESVETVEDKVTVEDKDNHAALLLWESLESKSNDQLSTLLKSSLVVGLVDSKWALLQSGTNLLLCDMDRLNYEMFLSLLIATTTRVNIITPQFDVNVSVATVFDDESVSREAVDLLKNKIDFLKRDFGIVFTEKEIHEGLCLEKLPIIVPGQRCPCPSNLETFIQRLCLVPDYSATDSMVISWQIFSELALLYGIIDTEGWPDWEEYVRHVILPSYRDSRARFSMSDNFKNDDDKSPQLPTTPPPLQIITNTETLYKSFERC